MSTYGYAVAPGYLSPHPTMASTYHSTHEDMNSYRYRQRDASTMSYHSRSDYARSTHSVNAKSTYSYDAKSTFDDSRHVYSSSARSVRSVDARPARVPDAKSTHSYGVQPAHSVNARSTYSPDTRSVRSTDAKSVHSTGARSSRSKSRVCANTEPQQFLNVQAAPTYNRSASVAGSNRSCAAPSLTHSVPSTTSDDENESDAGHPVTGPNTPYTTKVALWRDDVNELRNDVPPETILPPHVKARYEYERRQYGASPSLSSNDIPSIVVPPRSPPSRVPSPTGASPPHPLPSAPADIEHIVDEIEDIEYEVNARIIQFTFPSTLDFGERLPNGDFPPLPFTGRNQLLIEHKHYLDKSLLRMDAIQSFNDSRVRGARKRVVNKIQEQLEQLGRMEKMVRDNMHYERWKKTPRIQVTAPPTTT